VCGAATENARRANSVRVLAADSIGASEDRRGRTLTADWIRSFRYAGVDDERTLNLGNTRQVVHTFVSLSGMQYNLASV